MSLSVLLCLTEYTDFDNIMDNMSVGKQLPITVASPSNTGRLTCTCTVCSNYVLNVLLRHHRHHRHH